MIMIIMMMIIVMMIMMVNTFRFALPVPLFPDKLVDLGGAVLRATTFQLPPITYQVIIIMMIMMMMRMPKDSAGVWGGWEYSIVTALAQNMNFTLDISAPPDGERWGENKNGTFTGQQQESQGCGDGGSMQAWWASCRGAAPTSAGRTCSWSPTG